MDAGGNIETSKLNPASERQKWHVKPCGEATITAVPAKVPVQPKDIDDGGLHQKTNPGIVAEETDDGDREQAGEEEADDGVKRTNSNEPADDVARTMAEDGESTIAGETAEPVGDLGSNKLSALVKKLDASLSHSTDRTNKR